MNPIPPPSAIPDVTDEKLLERVQRTLQDVRAGKAVILVDDEDRENEGDLVFAAEHTTAEAVNFMAKFGRGLICLTLRGSQIDQLELQAMPQSGAPLATAFTTSIEARHGVTTGISAADRAHTIAVAIADHATCRDIVTPGHIFPLRAREGGVLVRTGQTEGSIDLAALAGLKPAGVICEIMNDDGTMARMPDLKIFAEEHDLQILSIEDLIRYRLMTEKLVRRTREFMLKPDGAKTEWQGYVYDCSVESDPCIVLVKGEPADQETTLCRMHAGALVSDVFGSAKLRGRQNLQQAITKIEDAGHGVIVYFPPRDGASDALSTLGEAIDGPVSSRSLHYSDPPAPNPVVAGPPLREFGLGAQILADLGLKRIALLTNHPRKIAGINAYGIEVAECVPLRSTPESSS